MRLETGGEHLAVGADCDDGSVVIAALGSAIAAAAAPARIAVAAAYSKKADKARGRSWKPRRQLESKEGLLGPISI